MAQIERHEVVRAVPEEVLKPKILPQIPAGRLGEPEKIARCVVFLASDDAGFITGSTISANGSQSLAWGISGCRSAPPPIRRRLRG